MSLNDKLLKQKQNAGKVVDQSKETKGGGGAKAPEAGPAYARLIGYVELGDQPRTYQGKPKDPAPVCNLTFEVYGKKNKDEYEKDGKKETSYRILRVSNLLVSSSSKARFFKLFKDMANGRDVKHMAEMLNECFKINIEHNESNGKTYANIKSIGAPNKEVEDEDGNIELQDVTNSLPPTKRDLQLFIFDAPTLDQWNSIYIEGEREVEKEGPDGTKVKVTQSNNFLQDTIVSAPNFPGSDLEALLADLGDDAMESDEEEEDIDDEDFEEEEIEEEEPVKKPAKTVAKSSGAATKKKAASASAATKSPSKAKKAVEESVEDIDLDDMFDDED